MAAPEEVPAPISVREQLAKILASSLFSSSPMLSRLLTHIVEQTLEGKTGELKEYALAISVFGRPNSFDSRLDPVVRVQASNLRSRLAAYYSGAGISDQVVIEVPRGGYLPRWSLRPPAEVARKVQRWERGCDEGEPVIAVLPCADLSAAQDQEYFCDGITEEVTSALSAISSVHVTARTSAFYFKGRMEDVREIGSRLGATFVLESSLRRDKGRIRLTARLTRVETGLVLWSHTFDADLHDVFVVQEDIARSIARAAKVEFTQDASERIARGHYKNLQTFNKYLLAKFHLNKATRTNLARSILLFREVIERDPANAPAQAGLARCWLLQAIGGAATPSENMPKALESAIKSQSLDPGLFEAYTVTGLVQALYEWNWKTAEESFRQAIRLNPTGSEARTGYAFSVLLPARRMQEAIEELKEAVKWDPVSTMTNLMLAYGYYAHREYDEAIRQCDAILDLDPAYARAYALQSLALALNGKLPEAARKAEMALELTLPDTFAPVFATAACGFALSHQERRAEDCLKKLRLPNGSQRSPFWAAMIHAALGRTTQAIRLLDAAIECRDPWVASVSYQVVAEALRQHSRFPLLMAKLGLEHLIDVAVARSPRGSPVRSSGS